MQFKLHEALLSRELAKTQRKMHFIILFDSKKWVHASIPRGFKILAHLAANNKIEGMWIW